MTLFFSPFGPFVPASSEVARNYLKGHGDASLFEGRGYRRGTRERFGTRFCSFASFPPVRYAYIQALPCHRRLARLALFLNSKLAYMHL